ncbi:hypothetical protein CONLIGDRAFT_363528 [Coniochaeta ligniaria NRRL 30616]|uniref:DUF6594 domain-containing protein n=1 Tax=Coniochaeta ligniaria NRRL 30616 TaxID=1408157 RepID=A0A1J7IS55_9PEZI|nr:hypothetical protein CONLIGDRAFT_363528 [Coniochaeta ligniaria NRRL 30616]
MNFFAKDHNEAEQGLRVPLGDVTSSSQPSAAQTSTALRPSVAPSMDGIEERPTGSGTHSGSILDTKKIRRKDEVTRWAMGWPRFAAVQASLHNAGVYRRFGYLYARLLLYTQGRLDNLQQQLEAHEKNPATDNRGLTARQTRKVNEPDNPDQLDLIMAEVRKELHGYGELQLLDRNTQALLTAYESEVQILYSRIGAAGMIDESGAQAAYEITDFIYTRPDLVHNGIRGLLSMKHVQKLCRCIIGDRELSSALFERVLQILVVLYILFMLLTPAALIYLLELSKYVSYGLVVVFSVVFCGSLVVANTSFERFLVGTCTYAAVLITILMQTQVIGGASCT